MMKLLSCLFAALFVAGCANAPPPLADAGPCAKHEASWDCQVERYGKVNAP